MITPPLKTIFYSIEKTIKEYRRYSQDNISKHISDITLDQVLVLIMIDSNSKLNQKEVANILYKDHASITRMIELLVKKGYVKRKINREDRRRFDLQASEKGITALKKLKPVILNNRSNALKNITQEEIDIVNKILLKITNNCSKNN
ncbi:MarR family winged helix-turn-helix transcriptional regulator [Hanstruepera marina]|uniref:MarR family winged helix-turn-helix transcriptional regulator n=1 Tax=Hanstruepera marina TaxID=2873265 RepID=UPI001CA72ED9|nr:MarR family transcriptional regulator [Hanstruepera marina]